MIAKLKGIIETIGDGFVIVDVGGVGYLVFCSHQTLTNLPARGQAGALFIETHVREDHIHLYGFLTEEEKKWFLLLTKVQGVGAKVALAVLSIMKPSQIATTIISSDKNAFAKAEGVGAKLALRIITELKDKAEIVSFAKAALPQSQAIKSDLLESGISALINLGYQRAEAYLLLTKIISSSAKELTLSELIKSALKTIGKKE